MSQLLGQASAALGLGGGGRRRQAHGARARRCRWSCSCGAQFRIVPVRVTGLTITEKLYDDDPQPGPRRGAAAAARAHAARAQGGQRRTTDLLARVATVAYTYTLGVRQAGALANLGNAAGRRWRGCSRRQPMFTSDEPLRRRLDRTRRRAAERRVVTALRDPAVRVRRADRLPPARGRRPARPARRPLPDDPTGFWRLCDANNALRRRRARAARPDRHPGGGRADVPHDDRSSRSAAPRPQTTSTTRSSCSRSRRTPTGPTRCCCGCR